MEFSRRGMVMTSQDSGHWSADPAAKPGLIWIAVTGKNHLFGTGMTWLKIQDIVTGQVSAELDMTPPLQR
jgi:hypothetical protein